MSKEITFKTKKHENITSQIIHRNITLPMSQKLQPVSKQISHHNRLITACLAIDVSTIFSKFGLLILSLRNRMLLKQKYLSKKSNAIFEIDFEKTWVFRLHFP